MEQDPKVVDRLLVVATVIALCQRMSIMMSLEDMVMVKAGVEAEAEAGAVEVADMVEAGAEVMVVVGVIEEDTAGVKEP